MDFACTFGFTHKRQNYEQVYRADGARWPDLLALDAGDPAVWRCKFEGGPAEPFELNRDSLPKVRAIADNPFVLKKFSDSIRGILEKQTDQDLSTIFENEIDPVLAAQGTELVQNTSGRFFGKLDAEGRRSGGMLTDLREFFGLAVGPAANGTDSKSAKAAKTAP